LQTRTQQTAAPLGALTGLPVKLNPLLQERSFGELRGQMFAHLAEQGINPFATGYAPPGGESIEVFERRCDRAWRLVLDEAEGTPEGQVLAVVTHGLVLDYFARKHVQVPGGVGPSMILFTNTSVTHIDTSGAHNPYPVLGELFNDDSHLSDENRDKTYGKFISSI
jgi:probable phosphoglycerate mutase